MKSSPSYADGAPIAAIATALAESALSIIRCSGPGAIELAASVFSRPGAIQSAAGYTAKHGWVVDREGRKIDEAVALVVRGPASYTGEDGVEFTCHGGVATTEAVLGALLSAGFRRALPGEFTFRAFLNGKLDLTRAEAVLDMVAAKTDEARAMATGRLLGAVEEEVSAIKAALVDALAAVELSLDYAEDEADPEAALDRGSIEKLLGEVETLIRSYGAGRVFRSGATVALAGLPNAGKSKLFNRILREERSIVSDTPGTTRDWIEAWISLEGVPVRLVDTAGLRESVDEIEREGVARTRALASGADLLVYVVDGTRGLRDEDVALLDSIGVPTVRVWNKVDTATTAAPSGYLPLSAKTGEGLGELIQSCRAALLAPLGSANAGPNGEDAQNIRASIASERQKSLLERCGADLRDVLEGEASGLPLDLLAPLLRDAVDALGEITGEVSTADLLETMFSRFCVGK